MLPVAESSTGFLEARTAGKLRAVMQSQDVLDLVSELATEGNGEPITEATRLLDIGFDSIACAELAVAAEERYGLDLADDAVGAVATVGELAAILERAEPLRVGSGGVPDGLGRFQQFSKTAMGGLMRWWFDLEVEGAERMPASGPVVMGMNHESVLDIPAAVVASPRPVTFMAKQELFRRPAAARIFHELGGFSVDRAVFDLRAVEIAMAVLARGEVLGMYPEGTRKPGVLQPFLLGAAWLALRTGAPLLPVAIRGTEAAMPPDRRLPARVPVRVMFAPPIPVEPVGDAPTRRKEAVRLTSELRGEIEGMLTAGR
jgi:1-acyl-sn-glycerol-3-phosphate acyltransferase